MNPRRIGAWALAGLLAVALLVDRLPAGWGYEGLVTVRGEPAARLGPATWRDVEGLPSASFDGTLSARLARGGRLVVRNAFGDVRLRGEPTAVGQDPDTATTGTVSVRYRVTVYAATQQAAETYLSQVRVELRPDGGEQGDLVLSTIRPAEPAEVRRVEVDIDGALPSWARLDVQGAFGVVDVQGLDGPSRVDNRYGRTTLGQLRGDWHVQAAYGTVEVTGVAGSLQVTGDFGSSDVREVEGDVTLQGRYRGHAVSGVGGDVAIEAAFGDVRVDGFRRNVQVDSHYANVTLRAAPPLDHRFDVEARFGNVATRIPGLAQAGTRTSEGPTQRWTAVIGQGRYRVEVRSEFGGVEIGVADGAPGGTVR
ncbi:DUF4097 family beta strand repeat-containing protein [Geochorda subterranea]|uniref:Adhesin domain-containing protein n=1 Tax=Geochorda subterranea TaxID=3109564 RepID=A0ABZ1BPG7_9FIRM|nr:hypothetical protein [Limnochorda sp. LNt]WRP14460.1 hypothetical protein VLY81_13725 [Limnochorda sp. LNt]